MGTSEEQEARVRPLAAAGLSTRKIADALGNMSQPTVVRTLKRINSGPNPILQPDDQQADPNPATESYTEPFPSIQPSVYPGQGSLPSRTPHESRRIGWVLVTAMIVLAAVVVGAVWYKLTQAQAAPSYIPACAMYASDGSVTKIVLSMHNHCATGWQFLRLIPG